MAAAKAPKELWQRLALRSGEPKLAADCKSAENDKGGQRMPVTVAEEWLNACAGCEISILNTGEALLDLLP